MLIQPRAREVFMENLVVWLVLDYFFSPKRKPVKVTIWSSSIVTVSAQKIDFLPLLLCWKN